MVGEQAGLQYMANSIHKPSVRDDLQNIASPQEIERRLKRDKQLEELGISTSNFDFFILNEHEDEDVLEAIILANQGKEIPKELKKKILDKKQEANQDNQELN